MNQSLIHRFSARDRTRACRQAQSLECDNCLLLGSALCRTIREAESCGVRQLRTRQFDRGQTIVEQGELPSFLGVLKRGYVRQERLRLNGGHVLFGLACPGDIIGGPPSVSAKDSSEAATDIEVCTFDRATVEHLMLESPRFRQVILRETIRQHQRLLGLAWRLNALDSRERIIAFLVDATGFMPTELLPDGSLILQVEVSRRDWADLTNTAVETISRTIRYLAEKDMVISLTPYRIRIRDLDRLAFLAGIDLPDQRKQRGNRKRPPGNHCALPEATKRMTTVNPQISSGYKIRSIQSATTALGRGDNRRRAHYVEEKIRD